MFDAWKLEKKGKTNTLLLIVYLGLKWKLLDKVASNIRTYDHPDIEYIINLPRLKRWLHRDKFIKLFIFDEALSHLPSRTAMSRKNVSVMTLFAELSKGHGRMIFCSQIDKVDSSIKDSAFLRAIFYKDSKKVMRCQSDLFPPLIFTHIPKTPIRFDPDRLAEFSEVEGVVYSDLSLEYKVALMYVENNSMPKIAKELGVHKEVVRRTFKKVLGAWLKSQDIEILARENERE